MNATSITENGPSEEKASGHGLFHTLVVMGSALALGCGGISHDRLNPNGDSDGNHGGGGAGGALAGAGGNAASTTNATGGVASAAGGSGNASGGIGGMVIGTSGGSDSGVGAAGAAGQLACPPEQWACSPCVGQTLPTPSSCSCDDTRPKTPADCAKGQTFVCLGAWSETSAPSARLVPYECSCVSAMPDCPTICDETFGSRADCWDGGEQIPTDTTLCKCAVVFLR